MKRIYSIPLLVIFLVIISGCASQKSARQISDESIVCGRDIADLGPEEFRISDYEIDINGIIRLKILPLENIFIYKINGLKPLQGSSLMEKNTEVYLLEVKGQPKGLIEDCFKESPITIEYSKPIEDVKTYQTSIWGGYVSKATNDPDFRCPTAYEVNNEGYCIKTY